MKKYIKILIPSLSLVIAPFTITSCKKEHSHVIPTDYLKIEKGVLKGFDDNHQRAYQLEGYDTLMIPKEAIGIATNSFSPDLATDYDAPTIIHTIKYENGCQLKNFSAGINNPFVGTNFNNLPELTAVYFPPKYTGNHDADLFNQCPKLSLLDFSHASNDLQVGQFYFWITWTNLAQTGKVIFNQNISDEHIQAIKGQLEAAGKTWEVTKIIN